MTDYIRDPNDLNSTTDDDLPGQWSHADFEGGDPDERSYAQREEDREPLAYSEAKFGQFELADLKPIQDAINRDIARLAAITTGFVTEPIGYDGFGSPIYDHQVSVDWRDPAPLTIEALQTSLETMELATGAPMIPLGQRKIPAEGTE